MQSIESKYCHVSLLSYEGFSLLELEIMRTSGTECSLLRICSDTSGASHLSFLGTDSSLACTSIKNKTALDTPALPFVTQI
mmetsp:Transcript_9298/g.17742  ORF Transcript_9298/g.17742 Transcript_9298/m.17742 type:complete len:81 (-) Transcript_9298:1253-1495(-)